MNRDHGYIHSDSPEAGVADRLMAMLPKSDATNSYDLMNDLKGVLREEPERLWMDNWVQTLADQKTAEKGYTFYPGYGEVSVTLKPACGTVACEAGWMAILVRDRVTPHTDLMWRASRVAEAMLPEWATDGSNIRKEFDRLFMHTTRWSADNDRLLVPGTTEYVEDVIAELETVQERYAEELKAYILPTDVN